METDEKDHSAMGSSEVFRSNNITTKMDTLQTKDFCLKIVEAKEIGSN